jgi:hypothetical protein
LKIFIIKNRTSKTPPVAVTDISVFTDGLPEAAPGTLFEVLVTEGVNIGQPEQPRLTAGQKGAKT